MENIQEEMKNNDDGLNFLKSQDLKEISNRTFIHESELKKFLDEDFDGINKTKAMGFIQILQREYNIDLSPLKDRYLAYHQEIKRTAPEEKPSMIMEEVKSEERKKGFFSFIFLVGAIGLMAYLVNKYELLNFNNPNDIKTAEISSQNIKDKINLNELEIQDKPKIVKETKQEEPVVASEIKEDENKEKLTLNDVLKPTNNHEQENLQADSKKQESLNNENDIDLSKLNSELATNNTQSDGVSNIDENNDTNNSNAITNELYIIPNSKVWIGTIDLDTLKKKDFLAPRGKRVDIDTSKNQLIMIGHKFIKIYLNGEKVNFKRKGPIRFKYIDGTLTEINRKEFNKLAKGRQW